MASFSTKEVRNSLGKKGFVELNRDHVHLHFYAGERRTSVRTMDSHGAKDCDDELLSRMAKQLKITKREFIVLVNRPLSAEAYVSILQAKGIL